MLEEVEQSIEAEAAEEVETVCEEEGDVQRAARHLVAGPGQRATEGAQRPPHAQPQPQGQVRGHS